MNGKAKKILSILDQYIKNPTIPLDHTDSYTLLIAVVLSAQTTDERVNKATKKLFKVANSCQKMANLPLAKIKSLIRECGLTNRKATALKKLSIMLLDKYNGKVPCAFEELEKLPGVGHKSASVVMGHAFKKAAFPVDTHIFRLARRWKLSNGKNVKEVEKDLKKIFPQKLWNKIALQMILFGRKYCKARGHKKELCPICKEL